MRVYLDMCALKRPFDDQAQGRIALETQSVIRILSLAQTGALKLCNSAALVFENELNPNETRRGRVRAILSELGEPRPAKEATFLRASELRDTGVADMDALHIAFAEGQGADCLVTCDGDLLRKVPRLNLHVKVVSPIQFVEELDQ